MILKLGFMFAVPLYLLVAWFTRNSGPANPEAIRMMAPILAVFYLVQVVIVAPLVARQMIRASGGYHQGVMLVKLAFYESGAIYGFILSFIGKDPRYTAYFGLPAFFLMLMTPVGPPQRRSR